MTDGILLAELQRDRDLRRYDTIIIDEAHERSLNIDFLLGYLKRLLPRRPDLKLIITSATIDVGPVRRPLRRPPGRRAVVEVSGRTYPVEVRYRPLLELPEEDEEGEPVQRDQTEAIIDAVRELSADGPGDVLVFLPGEREIRDTADAFAELPAERDRASRSSRSTPASARPTSTSLLQPLLGRAPRRARHQRRRDVADRARHPLRRRHRRRADQPLLRADQGPAAPDRADQPGLGQPALGPLRPRRGGHRDPALLRGGLRGRPEFTDPEILRTNLASVILQMASLRLGDIARFPFVEPPDRRNVTAGSSSSRSSARPRLPASGRPDEPRRDALTRLGRRLARLPIDPRLGRMILEAERLGCLRDVAGDRRRAVDPGPARTARRAAAQADQLHARFKHESTRLPHLAQPVAPHQVPAARALLERLPPDVQARVPQLPAHPRVAGLRVPAAPGRQGDEARPRQRRSRDAPERARRDQRRGRHPPGAAVRAAQPHRGAGGARPRPSRGSGARCGSTSAPATPASRSSPAASSRAATPRS